MIDGLMASREGQLLDESHFGEMQHILDRCPVKSGANALEGVLIGNYCTPTR